jgi:hypothetical protein
LRKINQKRVQKSRKINQNGGAPLNIVYVTSTDENGNTLTTSSTLVDSVALPHQQYAYDQFMVLKEKTPNLVGINFTIQAIFNKNIKDREHYAFEIKQVDENIILQTFPADKRSMFYKLYIRGSSDTGYGFFPPPVRRNNKKTKVFIAYDTNNTDHTREVAESLPHQQYAYDYFQSMSKSRSPRPITVEIVINQRIITTTEKQTQLDPVKFTVKPNSGSVPNSDTFILLMITSNATHSLSTNEEYLRNDTAKINRLTSAPF